MNYTKFEFNGKFYKQKFGTPIGSAISRIISDNLGSGRNFKLN